MARVLIACEYSGRVREAFRALGHDAWSCDILPAEDGSPFHYQGDVFDLLSAPGRWDLMIAFPPCTHLASSGARHFAAKRADGRQGAAEAFARALWNAPVPRIVIENPVGILSRPYNLGPITMSFQPWEHGHGETKRTCLWIKGLPNLRPSNVVPGRVPRVHRMPQSANRWKERSRTYEGVASAMAAQWSPLL